MIEQVFVIVLLSVDNFEMQKIARDIFAPYVPFGVYLECAVGHTFKFSLLLPWQDAATLVADFIASGRINCRIMHP